MKADTRGQQHGLRSFAVEVAHPENGSESRIVIHAPSVEEAGKMATAAGRLVCSVSPVAAEKVGPAAVGFLGPIALGLPTD